MDLGTLSRDMQGEKRSFTPGQRMAASVVFNHKDGRYMIDSSAEKNDHAEKNILLWLVGCFCFQIRNRANFGVRGRCWKSS